MACRLVTPLAWISLMMGSHVGGKRIGELSTDFDGRSARCCQAWTAEFLAARLGGGERGLGALRDCLALVLGDGGEDVDGELVGVRVITRDELDAAFYHRGYEMKVARQAVELGDNELCLVPSTGCEEGPVRGGGGTAVMSPGGG
jgi:hypothetical protein